MATRLAIADFGRTVKGLALRHDDFETFQCRGQGIDIVHFNKEERLVVVESGAVRGGILGHGCAGLIHDLDRAVRQYDKAEAFAVLDFDWSREPQPLLPERQARFDRLDDQYGGGFHDLGRGHWDSPGATQRMGHECRAKAMINSPADSVLAGLLRRYQLEALGAMVAIRGCVHSCLPRPGEAQTLIPTRHF